MLKLLPTSPQKSKQKEEPIVDEKKQSEEKRRIHGKRQQSLTEEIPERQGAATWGKEAEPGPWEIERLCSLFRLCCKKGGLRIGMKKPQSVIQWNKDGEEQIQEN